MSNKNTPLVSIVMPSFNQARFIEESIDSVMTQDYGRLELIISDGGSSDGTLEILKEKSRLDPRIKWSSESDSGPASAINRSLSQVRGTIIGWLNSDDLYTPGAVSRAVEAFSCSKTALMIYGHGDHIDEAGKHLYRYPTLTPELGLKVFSSSCFICQPTVFFTHSMVKLIGMLDETYQTVFDYDYWLRAFKAFPERIEFLDAVQAHSRLHKGGITARARRKVAIEGIKVTASHFGRAESHWVATYLEDVARQSNAERGFDNLGVHAEEVLMEVERYLSSQDIRALRENIGRLE